jgi:hypothetical protein
MVDRGVLMMISFSNGWIPARGQRASYLQPLSGEDSSVPGLGHCEAHGIPFIQALVRAAYRLAMARWFDA